MGMDFCIFGPFILLQLFQYTIIVLLPHIFTTSPFAISLAAAGQSV